LTNPRVMESNEKREDLIKDQFTKNTDIKTIAENLKSQFFSQRLDKDSIVTRMPILIVFPKTFILCKDILSERTFAFLNTLVPFINKIKL
jgi:hypothetical protein